MLRPKAVSAYLADQSIVGDDLMSRIEELRDQSGEINDLRDTLYKYATECKSHFDLLVLHFVLLFYKNIKGVFGVLFFLTFSLMRY